MVNEQDVQPKLPRKIANQAKRQAKHAAMTPEERTSFQAKKAEKRAANKPVKKAERKAAKKMVTKAAKEARKAAKG